MHCTYDIEKTYRENYESGPNLPPDVGSVPPTPTKRFMGFELNSRLGIAAGLLLNSKWIAAYSRLGYDLLTYKTVRRSYRPCYPLPNWVFVTDDGALKGPIYRSHRGHQTDHQITSAVCFGMPSMAPEVWRKDVAVARNALSSGQRLIVSVVATPEEGWGITEIAEDFARCALWAKEAGADIVEANLSCPNVCTAEGSIYLDPDFSHEVAATLRERISNTPLLLKIGYFEEPDGLAEFLNRIDGVVDGGTMVNGITRPVLELDGRPVFGPSYEKAGVLGRAIHPASVQSVAFAREVILRDQLALEILAVGGAALVDDIEDFFQAGAGAVLMGSSPMYRPLLAIEAKQAHPRW